MSDIAAQLRHIYHLDTVQPEHPIRRAVEEIERLRRTVEASGRAIADAQRQISALVAAPSVPVEHDGPGGVVTATPAELSVSEAMLYAAMLAWVRVQYPSQWTQWHTVEHVRRDASPVEEAAMRAALRAALAAKDA